MGEEGNGSKKKEGRALKSSCPDLLCVNSSKGTKEREKN
jgi:hypothetical protein